MNDLDGIEDDELWDDNRSSDDDDDLQVDNTGSLPLACDADKDVPEEVWAKLFDDSDYSDFNGS